MRDPLVHDALDVVDKLSECLENVRLGLDYYEDGMSIDQAPAGELTDLMSLVSETGRKWEEFQAAVRPIKDQLTKTCYNNHMSRMKRRAESKDTASTKAVAESTPVPTENLTALDRVGGQSGNYIDNMNKANRDVQEGHYAP